VQDEGVGCTRPAIRWQCRAQLFLNQLRIVALGDANPVGHAQHVAIDCQPRETECVPEHDVRSLAANPWQLHESIDVGRDDAAVPGEQRA
jgi:hypothetical protein